MDDEIEREERAIYAIAILALLPVVIVTLVQRMDWDFGTTVSLGIVLLGVLGLVMSFVRWRRRPRLPRARLARQR